MKNIPKQKLTDHIKDKFGVPITYWETVGYAIDVLDAVIARNIEKSQAKKKGADAVN